MHYKDINDLIDSLVNDLLTEVRTILTDHVDNDYGERRELTSLVLLLEHIAENAQIYKALLVSKHIPFFTPRLMELITGMILHADDLTGKNNNTHLIHFDTPPDIARWYASSALIGTISMWLGDDMPYSPQFLAEQLIQLNPFRPH
ncbi:TetR-like C-terminal domain-containing protein [Bacillus sp. JCM 19041]|uniref:TetR-like C-terminal domain-containing protein n=1 Tax=Bacillus sp. JCM 19041 TaxID=1460637 RepID=UPI0006D08A5E